MKSNALYIIGQMVLWADMQALLLINYSDVFEGVASQLTKT